jgi:capsular polysaccharide biosynthesis protein
VVNLLRSYVSSIQSEGMARRVIERLGLGTVDPAAISRKIRAAANEAEFTISIEVTDKDPTFAQRVAQAAAELFVEDVQAFASRQDPLDRLAATMRNGGAQPAGQTWPRKKLLAFLGVGGGLVLGLLVALGLEWTRVELAQTPDEVEDWLGQPVLGSIPARKQSAGPRLLRWGRLRKA